MQQPPGQPPPYLAGNNPNPQVMVYQQVVPPTQEVQHYPHRQALGLGIIQLIVGILCIIFQGFGVALLIMSTYGGTGFWCAVFFIIAGSFGIVSSKKKTRGWIIAFMVMSILSAFFTCGIIINSSISLIFSGGSTGYVHEGFRDRYVVDGSLVVLALIEMVVAIWSSALGCFGTCCGPKTMGGTLQYISPGGQPVMIVNQATPGQQGMQQAYQPYPQGPGKQAL